MSTSPRPIPLVDLRAQHQALRHEIDQAIARVIENSSFILGAEVEAFESEMAAYLGVAHAIGVSNGTDGLHIALRALDIGPGDEVIVPSFSFIATATAVRMAGATPVFAEIDPATYHLDPSDVERRITPRTRAVVPVHLYGQSVDLGPFLTLARRHGLELVEDACQAHGAAAEGGKAGTIGTAGAFSFYPSKNLGALGDGGMVVTREPATAERLRRLRSHGETRKYDHQILGFNLRLDGLQAAILRVKLACLDGWNARRRAIGALYNRELAGLPIGRPEPAPGRDHVYHVYALRLGQRDALRAHLAALGIATVIHYPLAIHQQPAYAGCGVKPGELAASEAAAAEVLSLPLYPEMTEEQIGRVIDGVRSFFRS